MDSVDWGWKPLADAGDSLQWLAESWPALGQDAQYQILDAGNLLIRQDGSLYLIDGHVSEHPIERLWGIYRLVPESDVP